MCTVHGTPRLLDMVLRSSACLTKTMDVDHFLEVITTEIVEGMEVQAAGVLLYDHHLNDFRWRQVRDEHGVLGPAVPGARLIADRTALNEAFQTGEPLVVADGAGAPASPAECKVQPAACIDDVLIVPLNTREKTAGLLVLAKKKAGGFTDEDIRIGAALAGLVAMSIECEEFFEDALASAEKLEGFNRTKSRILNRLSHELRTPLAIIDGSVRTMEKKLRQRDIHDFDAAFARLNRQVKNLGRLELQVESIMRTGYAQERDMLAGLLESAASLIEVQAEQTPEIKFAASLLLRTVQEAFPAEREQWAALDMRKFGESVFEHVQWGVVQQGRRLNLVCDLEGGSEVLIPEQVLRSTIEGLVRNAAEGTPDSGIIALRGRRKGDLYVITVEDSGVGIPEDDWGLLFEGFYQVQETEDYTSGRPYSFNAGGKGMDLFRIKTFSRIYGFGLYFKSRRCEHLIEALRECPGGVDRCPYCKSVQDCIDTGGTVFEVELPVFRQDRNDASVTGEKRGN